MGVSPAPAAGAGLAPFTLLRAWRNWMEHSGRLSERTRTEYTRCMTRFLADVMIPLDGLTEAHIIAYLEQLQAKGAMRGQVIRMLKCFYRFAVPRELVPHDPTWDLNVPRKKYGEAPHLSPEDLERVLAAADRLDPRARPTLELIYATGARVGSICEVLPSEVNLVRRSIYFRVAKGDRPYTNPLGPRGMRAVLRLLELRDYVPPRAGSRRPTLVGVAAPVVQRWAKEAGEIAGVRVWTHLLRHTFAERVANDPAVPELVWAELMNHRDASLIRRYATARMPLKRDAVEPL